MTVLEDFDFTTTVADAGWSGDVGGFDTGTFPTPFSGSRCLTNGFGTQNVVITKDDPYQLGPGDVFQGYLYVDGYNGYGAGLIFGYQGLGGFGESQYYQAHLRPNSRLEFQYHFDWYPNDELIASSSISGDHRDQWCRLVVDWKTDGTIELSAFNESDTQIANIVAAEDRLGLGSWGIWAYSYGGEDMAADLLEANPGSGPPTAPTNLNATII